MRTIFAAALCAGLVAVSATDLAARGGGGGGGHGGGSHGGTYYYYGYYGGGGPLVPPTKLGDTSHVHTVAVISAVGQSLMLGRTGLLADHSTLDIADWHLDQSIETMTAKLLATHFTVKDFAHDSAALAKIPNGFMDTSSARALQDYIVALKAQDVDAFIVIRPDAETGTPPTPGLSLQLSDTDAHPREEANFEIDVVDAKSGAIIAHAYSRAAERQGLPPQFASFYGARALKLKPGDTPTPAQRTQLKLDFERDMAMAMRETLRALNLGIALPEIGARTIVDIPANESPCRTLKRVMVVSTVGDRVEVVYPGSLFTKRKDNSVPVGDWNFDPEVEKLATNALDRCFQVVNVPLDRAKLASLIVSSDPNLHAVPVDGITPGAALDLYLVIAKLRNDKGEALTGLALLGGGSDYGHALSDYAIVFIDAKTAKIAYWMQGISSPKFPYPVPSRLVASSNMPNPGDNFSPAQSANVRTLFLEMMTDSIPESLLRLQFTGKRIESAGAALADMEQADGVKTQPGTAAAASSP
ncbi:MAG: hypothetical protein JO261_11675 [Alphaproteobacteria bacterium]|nr:hypothetical protein [Alphaproteobacteria bacterium]MBV9694348.1 hypothetical protein [Alphaproteobacteria bacterium]